MCCFSRPVRAVSGTQIFARPLAGGRQALAYAMRYEADQPLAMLLPLPVPAGTVEADVAWLDLTRCPDLFAQLQHIMEPPSLAAPRSRGVPGPAQALAVVRVGSFEASFAPSAADLARLDPRFRLAPDVVAALPGAQALGFVVARLRPDATHIHPLAFTYPRRDPGLVVFPTLHVHDGQVHARAVFDHHLYLQVAQLPSPSPRGWRERATAALGRPPLPDTWELSPEPVGARVDPTTSAGLLEPSLPLARLRLSGRFPNQDVVVPG